MPAIRHPLETKPGIAIPVLHSPIGILAAALRVGAVDVAREGEALPVLALVIVMNEGQGVPIAERAIESVHLPRGIPYREPFDSGVIVTRVGKQGLKPEQGTVSSQVDAPDERRAFGERTRRFGAYKHIVVDALPPCASAGCIYEAFRCPGSYGHVSGVAEKDGRSLPDARGPGNPRRSGRADVEGQLKVAVLQNQRFCHSPSRHAQQDYCRTQNTSHTVRLPIGEQAAPRRKRPV